jgi:hypothetical protein
MIWNIIVNCLCGAVIAELAWQLRKRRRRIDELEQDIQTYDEILNDTQTENGRLREELEQTQRQLAKFVGCPELGIAYKLQDVGTKMIEVKRYVSRWQAEDCNFDLIEMKKDEVKRELVDQAKAMCSITARDRGSNVEICGRLAVGTLEADHE